MAKYKFLSIIYFLGIVSSSIANMAGYSIQNFLRVPLLNIRLIDLAIIIIMLSFFYNISKKIKTSANSEGIIFWCFIFLIYEIFQLIKSWKDADINFQIAGIICTLSIFIAIDLLFFKLQRDKILNFLKFFLIVGTCTIIIDNTYLLYSFLKGKIILTELNSRVTIKISGARETVYTSVLLSFVYASSLYFVENSKSLKLKLLFAVAILSIYISLIYTFKRGDLVTIFFITLIYIGFFSKNFSSRLFQVVTLLLIIGGVYFFVGDFFNKRGYNPVARIMQTAEFTVDVNNPDWEKGRSVPRTYAINAWKKNIWTGVGYNDLHNFGLPENINTAHNFIITSLFHRGIVGTTIYLLILFLLFRNAVKLWFMIQKKQGIEFDIYKLLIIASFFWLILFWNQEAIWEKYSLSIQFMYLGLISNFYNQIRN